MILKKNYSKCKKKYLKYILMKNRNLQKKTEKYQNI